MGKRNTFEGIGYTALGLGFLFQAAKAFGLVPNGNGVAVPIKGVGGQGVAGLGLAPGDGRKFLPGKPGGIIEKVTLRTVGDIRDRVSYIQERVRKDSLKPEVRELALHVLTKRCKDADGNVTWCVPEKDHEGEIVALYDAMHDPGSPAALRYTRDHATVDQYHAANKLANLNGPGRALNAGDCDDGTILLGSMLRSVGYQTRLRVIQDANSASWSHIYLLAGAPAANPKRWIPLDWSVKPHKPAGWEAPGAKDVAQTGKPSGVVTRLMDFAV